MNEKKMEAAEFTELLYHILGEKLDAMIAVRGNDEIDVHMVSGEFFKITVSK